VFVPHPDDLARSGSKISTPFVSGESHSPDVLPVPGRSRGKPRSYRFCRGRGWVVKLKTAPYEAKRQRA
jgi:hypothetical protein